ncbi:hypothetical protein B0H21DRAFT_491393 [Amylocystis lapponica]|nr:hypothetical protein B0H21DRAFT_491393 [Amylocystis lapponica]
MSPSSSQTNSDETYVFGGSPYSYLTSSRDPIKAELAGKLSFNDHRIFHRLGTDVVPDDLVDASMRVNAETSKARAVLAELLASASKKSEWQLEAELKQLEAEFDPEIGLGCSADAREPGPEEKTKAKLREKEMYHPLHTIFSFIESFDHTCSVPTTASGFHRKRHANRAGSSLGLPQSQSRLHVVGGYGKDSSSSRLPERARAASMETQERVLRDQAGQCAGPSAFQRQCRKAHRRTSRSLCSHPPICTPIPALLNRAPHLRIPLLRRHFRPRWRHVLPYLDMWADVRMFIRVIRRLTRDMTPVELGQDPTVRMLSDAEAGEVRRRAEAIGTHLTGAVDYPTYAVTMGKRVRCWYTLGAPIWTSLSLLGRGTEVWRVCDSADPNRLLVLKSAWRSSDRPAEAMLYEGISGKHPGVADYDVGADIVFPGAVERVISVKNLRDSSCDDAKDTPILHRLLTRTYGRSMWEYDSELELLKGFRAALEGHRFLSEQGILHRDISAGNVLLSAAAQPENGYEGFITDIESAHFSRPSVEAAVTKTIAVVPVVSPGGVLTEPTARTHTIFDTVSVKRGATMTGTFQFMAAALLFALDINKTITHELHHDLESFVWVFAYSIGMHFVSKGRDSIPEDCHKAFTKHFYDNFGQPTILQILNARGNIFGFLNINQRFPELFSEHFAFLLQSLNAAVVRGLEPLTYDVLFQLLDEAIAKLQ